MRTSFVLADDIICVVIFVKVTCPHERYQTLHRLLRIAYGVSGRPVSDRPARSPKRLTKDPFRTNHSAGFGRMSYDTTWTRFRGSGHGDNREGEAPAEPNETNT